MALSIIIIDDSGFSRKMLIRSLPSGEFNIREASGGLEGLSLYKEQRPDLAFLDLTMPGIDGFETLSRIKELDPESLFPLPWLTSISLKISTTPMAIFAVIEFWFNWLISLGWPYGDTILWAVMGGRNSASSFRNARLPMRFNAWNA